MLRISKKKDGKWFVDLFDDTHNLELSITPTKVMKHRSHTKFHRTVECKSLMVQLNQSGLKPSQIKKAINAIKTSNEVDVTSKQCVDVLSEQRQHNKGREFYGLIKHLQDKALVDNDQYYVVDLCSDGRPKNIVWADGRSRDNFTKFGDVVVFDVTYMTNKFKMHFAPFTRVNHHGQSILFGGALLENENEETFVWLFEHLLKLQYDKAVSPRRAAEEDEDFKTMNSRSVLSSIHPIEAKAGECYTRKVFEIFKKEWIEANSNLTHETLSKSTEEIKYRVGQLDVDKKYWQIVSFCLLNKMHVTCSYAKYETCGILCKHSLYVMKKRHVHTFPSHYILPRWPLNARYKVGKRSIGLEEIDNENGVSAYMLWCVRSNFNKVIEQAKDSPSEIENINNILIKLLQEQAIRKKPIPVENVSQASSKSIPSTSSLSSIYDRLPLLPPSYICRYRYPDDIVVTFSHRLQPHFYLETVTLSRCHHRTLLAASPNPRVSPPSLILWLSPCSSSPYFSKSPPPFPQIVPPFLQLNISNFDIRTGVNFAYTGSGYDDMTSQISQVIPMTKQLYYFKEYIKRLKKVVGIKVGGGGGGLVSISAGTNDFPISYYDLPSRRDDFSMEDYQDYILKKLQNIINELYKLGCRTMVVSGLPPMGCLPIQMLSRFSRTYLMHQNTNARVYNQKLMNLLPHIQSSLKGSQIMYTDIYTPMMEMIRNPRKHDVGTMSPFEHREAFVLDVGGEVDLDLGNYERFLDVRLTRDNNITTGKIYQMQQIREYNKRGKMNYNLTSKKYLMSFDCQHKRCFHPLNIELMELIEAFEKPRPITLLNEH
ncbi:unnamed protein product [Lactuca saligna]|uniref:Protein FAR1-RELATED SEQUENCE n=1 Tax=Lactuca saligna TaxID=75948 RepID=A0AA35Y0C8_LACSI|nr:unnamed protein product [Lactuca saligna]